MRVESRDLPGWGDYQTLKLRDLRMRVKSRYLPGKIDWQVIELRDWKIRVRMSNLQDSPNFLITKGRKSNMKHLRKELQE